RRGEVTMTDIAITIAPDATGTITIGDATEPITGQSLEHTRQEAMQQAKDHARATGAPATVTADDPTGTFYLRVQPDGNVLDRPAPTEANGPAWEQEAAPIVTEVPGAQNTVDLEATRPRHVAAPAEHGAPAPAQPEAETA